MNDPQDTLRIGRRPLLGGLAAAAALTPTGSSAAVPTDPAQLGDIAQVATRAQMAALSGRAGQAVLLTEAGREGLFILRDGGPPASDPLQGLYVPGKLASVHWARRWDGTHGLVEWFGARADDPGPAGDNHRAIEACHALCPIALLRAAAYHTADTLRLRVSNRTLRGTGIAIEAPFDKGTRILCADPRRDVIHVGGTGEGDRKALINVENMSAGWSVDLTVPAEGREGDAPAAFHVTHVIGAHLKSCHAVDPLIGFRFNGIINSRCSVYGVMRYKSYRGAGRDFVRGVWVQGRPSLFAGGNASLYLNDGNVSTSADKRAAYYFPMGIYADADFADLYIQGLETSQIAFPVFLDGAGGDYAGGHGDVHIRGLVLDQIIGDGVTIRNANPLAKIHIDGGYIQVVDSRQNNKGLWFENGSGAITVANLQITGTDDSSTSTGIYLRNQPNVSISDTVIVENFAFPVIVEKGCARTSLACTVNGGQLRARGHAAVRLDGASQALVRPKVTGAAGVWTAGVELLGAAHDRVHVDPTMVDPAAVAPGRKLVINGKPVSGSGHFAANGDRAPEGSGIMVTGIVA